MSVSRYALAVSSLSLCDSAGMASFLSSGSVRGWGMAVSCSIQKVLGGSALSPPPPDGPKDTSVDDALDKTYTPSLKTFEEEIMDAMGIVETRRAKKSYWY